jgi:hypothetical protein
MWEHNLPGGCVRHGNPDAPEDAGSSSPETTPDDAPMAMAMAARRPRHVMTSGATPAQDDLEGLLRSVPDLSVRETRRPGGRPETAVAKLERTPSERRLMVAVVVTAALVIAAAISLVVLVATRHQPSANQPPTVPTRPTTAPPSASGKASSSTLPAPTPGAAPVISSLNPSSATPGQTIIVSGANFMSPSGRIAAHVGATLASIACPEQSTCTVTVPPRAAGAPNSVMVTVTTDAGTSNAAGFTYR